MTTGVEEALLVPKPVGDIEGHFHIASYQRGYRWGEVEVLRLLDDIWTNRDRAYYLQPVVVKPRGEQWELVDGQQRLTTLYLILEYMRREGLQSVGANFSLNYETRPESAAYLDSLDGDKSQSNIDFFHIHEAYSCIRQWFEKQGNRRQYAANQFYDALFKHVKVIWYEAPADLDSVDLFTRLNVGRIPLTDAELVKALLLSQSRSETAGGGRTHEMAAQWDLVEQDLRNPELWAFINDQPTGNPTRISLLLDTLAGGPAGRERPLYYTFEELRQSITDDHEAFWNRVLDLHSLVVGWFENPNLFHKVGYLIRQETSLATLVSLAEGKARSQFEGELDRIIRADLALSETGLLDLTYGRRKTAKALLLMNVETMRRRGLPTERFSFDEYARGQWSVEHIHAQNAESLTREEQWRTWLERHRHALATVHRLPEDQRASLLSRIDIALADTITRAVFRELEHEVFGALSADQETPSNGADSIANLALLHRNDNSALSNSVFAVKRMEVLERDRESSYVPVCTRNVFLKYYTPADEQQTHFWSTADREHYLGALTAALRPYLETEESE